MKQIYDFEPKPVEHIVNTGITTTVIRFDVHEIESAPDEDGKIAKRWECEEVEYNHRESLTREKDYGPMVSAIIRSRYSQDQVEAITQNYLAAPEDHKEEFETLQSWRVTAKNTANRIINI